MSPKERLVLPNSLQHIYQRAYNNRIIFYDSEDCLVFFSILSIIADRLKLPVIALCLMIDHIHILIDTDDKDKMSNFVKSYTSIFTQEYNKDCHRSGSLFDQPYGSASKLGGKKIRTSISYIYNNPVEKNICKRAIDDRWGFLAYSKSKNPFSSKIQLSHCQYSLRKAVKLIEDNFKKKNYLKYSMVRNVFQNLNGEAKEQLIDYIINLYNPIDYEKAMSYYGNIEKMILAIDSNTGSEYQLKEVFTSSSDAVYLLMNKIVHQKNKGKPVKHVLRLPDEEKLKLSRLLASTTMATSYQINRFLNL